jgi:hypothetical protein
VNGELERMWKDVSWPNLMYYPSWHLSGGTEKNHKKTQNSWSPGRDLNPDPTNYKAGVLTIQARYLVSQFEEVCNSHKYYAKP